jgi:ligand-binding sensor protein
MRVEKEGQTMTSRDNRVFGCSRLRAHTKKETRCHHHYAVEP